jgi:quaternary ammonium compound-resistance protein SugE
MAWIILVVAGIFEVVWAIALKYSEGFTKLWPSVIFVAAAWLSFACLSLALKHIPMGSAYAVWTGIGAVGIAIVGIGLVQRAGNAASCWVHRPGSHRYRRAKIDRFRNRYYVAGSQRFLTQPCP